MNSRQPREALLARLCACELELIDALEAIKMFHIDVTCSQLSQEARAGFEAFLQTVTLETLGIAELRSSPVATWGDAS